MKNDNHIIASIGTAVIMLLLFLLLWLIYLDRPFVPEEEGIEVAFGESLDGSGMAATMPDPMPIPSPAPAPSVAPSSPATPSSNDLMTQEDEESLALQREQERKRKEQQALADAERRRQQQEAARLEQERKAAEAKALAEAKAKAEAEAAAKAAAEKAAAEKAAAEQAKRDKASNAMAGLFGNNGSSTGSGDGTGDTKKGNPAATGEGTGAGTGSGTSGSGRWSLAGRSLKGSLAQPAYGSNAEGTVVVRIRVNAAGQVIEASLGQGSTTSDQSLINAAIAAAKKATFSAGSNDVIGSITYVFKLK